jgi:hypothetical protein
MLCGAPREVGTGGRSGQLPLPVRELFFERRARQPLALPYGEVRVLNRQLRERRIFAPLVSRVEGGQFAYQHARRPPIGDDVVHRDEHHVLFIRQPHERGAQQRPPREIEGALRLLVHQPPRRRLTLAGALARKVDQGQGHGLRGHDLLRQFPAILDEACAQHLVAAREFGERATEGVGVEPPRQPDGRRTVVKRIARFQLV